MPNGKIQITHNFTGETNYVILVWYKTSAPLAEVGRQEYPAPHSQESLLIENLDTVMYFVKAYRSSDGIALDTEINVLACDAKSGAIYPITKYEYEVDRNFNNVNQSTGDDVWQDPIDGEIELRDERLKDKTYYVEERGTGTMFSNEITDRSDDGGGFDWAVTDKVFEHQRKYIIWVIEAVDASEAPSSTSGFGYSDVLPITTDDDFEVASMGNKILLASKATTGLLTITLPALSTLSDCRFKMTSFSGNQKYFSLQLQPGETIRFMSEDMNVVHLGKSELLEVFIKDNVAYVIDYKGVYDKVGQRVLLDYQQLNSIPLDGTLYNQVDEPRLMWFVEKLDSAQVVTEAQWASAGTAINGDTPYPNKGKYARDDVGGTIRVPDDRHTFYRALNSLTADSERITQGVGSYEHFKTSMKNVNGSFEIRDGAGGSATGTIVGTGFSGQDNFASWVDGNNQIRFSTTSQLETRPKNTGLIAHIII